MGKVKKTFTCTYENCAATFNKRYELKKHGVEKHGDSSKLLRTSVHKKAFEIHMNGHLDKRPFVCPDTIKVVASTSDSSLQTLVDEKPCGERFNDDSALLKHRKEQHGYTPDPERSRRCVRASRGVDGGAKMSRFRPFPVPPRRTVSGDDEASYFTRSYPPPPSSPPPVNKEHYPAPDAHHTFAAISHQESFYDVANNDAALSAPEPSYNSWSQTSRSLEGSTVSSIASYTSNYDNSESTNTYATVQLSAAEHPLINRFSSQLNILHGRVPEAGYAQKSTDATSASTSQYSYGDRGVNLTGNYSVHTSAETPDNANSFTWLGGPNPPGVQSSTWGSVASRTTNYDSSLYPTNSFPRVEPPFKNSHSEQASQYGNSSTNNAFVVAPAVQPNHASSTSVASYTANYYNSESEDSYAAPQPLSAERNFSSGLSSNLDVTRSEASNAFAPIHESPAVESIYSSSVALHTTNSYSLPYPINSFPRAEPPSNNDVHFEQASSYDNSLTDNGFVGTLAVQSNDTNSSSTAAYTASFYNSESGVYAVPQLSSAESHLDNGLSSNSDIPRAEATNALPSPSELTGASQSIGPTINDTDRGATGYIYPEIIVYMDVEEWDSYIVDVQREYTHL